MSRLPKRKLTTVERRLRNVALMNAAENIVYRRNRYYEARDDQLNDSIVDRRYREYMTACEVMVEIGSHGITDAYLRCMGGEKAVADRDKLLGAGADVVPFKRGGRPPLGRGSL
ncbi:MAG: hypothetical protein EON59_08215 [Alphaproteobacteria bacterium]|nr:MAG: hypothetical protein EON59_08215 [Alphaproteobacteria bacterium]